MSEIRIFYKTMRQIGWDRYFRIVEEAFRDRATTLQLKELSLAIQNLIAGQFVDHKCRRLPEDFLDCLETTQRHVRFLVKGFEVELAAKKKPRLRVARMDVNKHQELGD